MIESLRENARIRIFSDPYFSVYGQNRKTLHSTMLLKHSGKFWKTLEILSKTKMSALCYIGYIVVQLQKCYE